MNWTLTPEILTHPNIPKALHGICPRTIEGQSWWNKTRQAVYASTDYHCKACGVHKSDAKKHKWLEAHEYWHIDYIKGVCTISEIVPLCHYCHNFIHSGRLTALYDSGNISREQVVSILEHGFAVLCLAGLRCFYVTEMLADAVGAEKYGVQAYIPCNENNVAWEDWTLLWGGNEYKSLHASYEAWREFYREKNNEIV